MQFYKTNFDAILLILLKETFNFWILSYLSKNFKSSNLFLDKFKSIKFGKFYIKILSIFFMLLLDKFKTFNFLFYIKMCLHFRKLFYFIL